MSTTVRSRGHDAERDFRLAFAANIADVDRFVRFRLRALDTDAIVAETFLIARRRWTDRPHDAVESDLDIRIALATLRSDDREVILHPGSLARSAATKRE